MTIKTWTQKKRLLVWFYIGKQDVDKQNEDEELKSLNQESETESKSPPSMTSQKVVFGNFISISEPQ